MSIRSAAQGPPEKGDVAEGFAPPEGADPGPQVNSLRTVAKAERYHVKNKLIGVSLPEMPRGGFSGGGRPD